MCHNIKFVINDKDAGVNNIEVIASIDSFLFSSRSPTTKSFGTIVMIVLSADSKGNADRGNKKMNCNVSYSPSRQV